VRAIWRTWLVRLTRPPSVVGNIRCRRRCRWLDRGGRKVDPEHLCEETILGTGHLWGCCDVCRWGWVKVEGLWVQDSSVLFLGTEGVIRGSFVPLRRFGIIQHTVVHVNFGTTNQSPSPIRARPYHLSRCRQPCDDHTHNLKQKHLHPCP